MVLRLGNPDNFRHVSDQLNQMIDDMLGQQFVRFCPTDPWRPNVNLYDTTSAYLVCADLAGMRPEQIQIHTQDRKLLIRGTRATPVPPDDPGDVRLHVMEIDCGAFHRTVDIPEGVNMEGISATYRDGFLWISLPKLA